MQNAVLIAGPTASGKSALAIRLARERHGVVVNADSMQVYSVLRVITARPDERDLRAAPHLLYGHVQPSMAYSAGAWLRDVEALVASGAFRDRIAIFTGGTGLYFRALTGGLADLPAIPARIRRFWRAELERRGAIELHQQLARLDLDTAHRLNPADGQRIIRALEVREATGSPLSVLISRRHRPMVDMTSASAYLVDLARPELHRRIEARVDNMIDAGALAEARTLDSLGLDTNLPAMKAIGVPQFIAAARGELSLESAREKVKASTRQYAKRQMTWFRHQLGSGWQRVIRP